MQVRIGIASITYFSELQRGVSGVTVVRTGSPNNLNKEDDEGETQHMRPLEGIKVVEFATHVVVPVAARVMGDWGAEVIKIESLSGDKYRTAGLSVGMPVDSDCNPIYSVYNSGKKMVSLNLKTEEGKEALFRILEDADVFCTNIRWAGIQRLGLDYDTLHARFPRLIYMHFSGFGYEGPDAPRPAFDSIAFFSATGILGDWPQEGDRPMISPPALGDMVTSNSVLSGIMAALFHRERTGEGLRVTTSLFANGIWCNHAHIVGAQEGYNGIRFPRRPNQSRYPMSGLYQCKDGRWLLLAAGHDDFDDVMGALGLNQYIGDERFSTPEAMDKNHQEVRQILTDQFLTKDCSEWENPLREIDVPYQKLMTASEVSKSEQAWANGYLTRTKFPNGKEAIEPNSPVKFFGIDLPETQSAGYIGDDTSEILRSVGYSDEQICAMMEKGAAAGK